jgi:hypothetical protein
VGWLSVSSPHTNNTGRSSTGRLRNSRELDTGSRVRGLHGWVLASQEHPLPAPTLIDSILSFIVKGKSVFTASQQRSCVVSTCKLAGTPCLAMLVNTSMHLRLCKWDIASGYRTRSQELSKAHVAQTSKSQLLSRSVFLSKSCSTGLGEDSSGLFTTVQSNT